MTIENNWRFALRSVLLSGLLVSFASCHHTPTKAGLLAAEITQQPGFPQTLRISIINKGDEPICIPGEEIDSDYNKIRIIQNGKRVFPEERANIGLRDYKGINSLEPVHIALKGRTEFWYQLDTIPIENGSFMVEANIRTIPCSSLFDSKAPDWTVLPARATFVASSSAKK